MKVTEATGGAESEDTSYSSALLPRIERLPPGMVVTEAEMGRTTGQWVRCAAL